jgi:HEAT repeat protein
VTCQTLCNCEAQLADLDRRLRSLHEGDVAVIEAIALGADAVPVLRKLLFERDRAGIFQTRTRAVQALGALNAIDVLKEFVAGWQPAADPVERLGDEAVLSAAARTLGATHDEQVFSLLSAIACMHRVPGVIEALAHFKRVESIPILIEALTDDCASAAAEQGLRSLGKEALPALLDTASYMTIGASGRETLSSTRRRRRALSVLLELGASREACIRIRGLANDADDEIAALACRIGIAFGEHAQQRECAWRLVELLHRVGWPLRREIEDCLMDNFPVAREFVDRALAEPIDTQSADNARMPFIGSLRRVKAKASSGDDALC